MKDIRHCRMNLNYWWPVAQKSTLLDSDLYATQVDELELVVLKDSTGNCRIFQDVCPHRRVRLSQFGRKEKDELVCGYHGWRFNLQSGACRAMPHESRLRETCCLKAYPTQVYGDWIWVFPGEPQFADQIALPHINAVENPLYYLTISLEQTAHCHFSYLVENALDLFHSELHQSLPLEFKTLTLKMGGNEPFFSSLMENMLDLLDAGLNLNSSFQPWSETKLVHYQKDERMVKAVYEVAVSPLATFFGASQDKLHTHLIYAYPYIYQDSEDGRVSMFSTFVPVGQQQTRIYSTFSIRILWPIPWLTGLLQFNLNRGLRHIIAQDIQAVEEEQRAYNLRGRDDSLEPNPVTQAARWLIRQQDVSIAFHS